MIVPAMGKQWLPAFVIAGVGGYIYVKDRAFSVVFGSQSPTTLKGKS
jgi:hypothetical protein